MVPEFMSQISPDIMRGVSSLNLNISSPNCNREINALLQRTVLSGGKRIRPLLTFLMGEFFGLNVEKIRPFAQAVEMVHAASLAHDDVIDNATTRRGADSINKVASNKYAVLAGDYLLSDVVFSVAAQGDVRLVQEISKVIQELSMGEWLQLDASISRQYDRMLIEEIAKKKTSSVMCFCSIVAPVLTGCDEREIELARKFGESLGVAFQLIDDSLDFSKDSQKDAQLDLQNGIVNAVLFEWLELHPQAKNSFLAGESLEHVFSVEGIEKAVKIVQDLALLKLDECRQILDKLSGGDNVTEKRKRAHQSLLGMINFLIARTY